MNSFLAVGRQCGINRCSNDGYSARDDRYVFNSAEGSERQQKESPDL